jgi:hypothetical protein
VPASGQVISSLAPALVAPAAIFNRGVVFPQLEARVNKLHSVKVQRSKPLNQLMKKLLFAFAITLLLLPFAPQAKSQQVSVDFFYNNLSGGSWIEVGNYGYCWQPDIAVSDPSWRPYADGYWAYTDDGWTWVSYEDFGWATYHYGRWVRLADYGWVWRPGYEWGPAWVSWRFGGGYCGWAPLPPETEVIYESRPLTGHLDVEFDIGPACYNFVDVRYIGEPVLRSRIVEVNQNVTYINQTVNVTNITYKNKTVYNYGPDLNVVNQYSSRPVQRLKLERQANVDVAAAAKSGGLTKVQGNALVVAAPTTINKSAKQIAPPTVKTKVAEAKVEHGWSVAGDANAQTQLKEQIKTQDLKKVPPPTAGAAAAAGAGTSVPPSASLVPGMAPVEKGKKGKTAEQFQPGVTASPAGAFASPTTSPAIPERGKKKGKAVEQFQPGAPTSPIASPGAASSPSLAPEYGKPGKGKRGEKFGPPPTGTSPGTEGVTAPEGKRKGFERGYQPTPGGATSPTENLNEPRGGKQKKLEQQPGMLPSGPQGGQPGAQGGPYGEGRGKHKAEGVNAPPAGGAQTPAAGQPGGGKHEGKGKGAAGTPTPGPQ